VEWSRVMASVPWSDWQVVQLQECFVRGIAPEETAALLGRTKEQICEKAREVGLHLPARYEESPSKTSTMAELFPRDIAASRMMIGSGIPMSQSSAPFPKPIVASCAFHLMRIGGSGSNLGQFSIGTAPRKE